MSQLLRQRRSRGNETLPWEAAFGGLKQLHRENRRIDRIIAAEFETIDQEDWR